MTSDPTILDLTPVPAADAEVGTLLAQLDAGTRKWRAELGRVGVDRLRLQSVPGAQSIGALLLHIAESEAYWLHQVAAGRKLSKELERTLMVREIDQYAGRWPAPPKQPLAWYNAQLDAVRAESRSLLSARDAGSICHASSRTYTLRRILHHVAAHESYHGGQAVLLKLQMARGLPPIVHATYIAAPPPAVYRTLTTAEGWNGWFTVGSEVDARPGGVIRLRWRNWGPDHIDAEDVCPILDIVPDRRLSFRWRPGDGPTTVTFDLEPRGTGTVVRLTETGYVTHRSHVDCTAGWAEALTLLKVYLEHGITYGAVPPA